MKRRWIGYIILLFTVPVLLLASSNMLLSKIKPALEFFHNRFGDTYRLCNLREFREALEPIPVCPGQQKKPDVHLHLVGDSYSWKLGNDCYLSDKFTITNWRSPLPVPEKGNRNILVLETTERFARERFASMNHFLQQKRRTDDTDKSGWEKIFSFDCEENLQSILFLDGFSLFMREIKADIQLHWFGKIDEGVAFSSDSTHLFITETTDSSLQTSSFAALSDQEVLHMIKSLRILEDHARKLGYQEVYLSVIPSKVSIIDPGYNGMTYNKLVERLEKALAGQVNVISVLPWISRDDYYPNDTHWNQQGAQKWLRQVNDIVSNDRL